MWNCEIIAKNSIALNSFSFWIVVSLRFASQNDLIFMKVFMISSTLNKAVLLIRFVKRAYLLRSVKLGTYSSFNPCQLRFSFRIIMNGGKGLLINSRIEWYTGLLVLHVTFWLPLAALYHWRCIVRVYQRPVFLSFLKNGFISETCPRSNALS